MMEINLYDEVILKDGRTAAIVEIFSESNFLADVGSSPADWDTIDITIDDIAKVIPKNILTESKLPKFHEVKITDGIRASVVDIRFESGRKLSYYNDKFDLHIGDIVYVDGKLEGQRGRVVDINYNFRIKLSDYKKVISVVDTNVSGKFYTAGSHSVAFNSSVIPKEKIKLWFMAPQNDEDVVISGNDDSFFYLDDIDNMGVSETVSNRGGLYFIENKVPYIEINGTKGYAIVEGTRPYEVEFKYEDGKISNLTCDCFCTYKCKHEVAAMFQLKEIMDNIKKYYFEEYSQSGYFAAIRTATLFALAIDGKTGKSFEI